MPSFAFPFINFEGFNFFFLGGGLFFSSKEHDVLKQF